MPYIKRQIEILNPDVIVMVGKNISEIIIPDDFRSRFIKVYHTAFRYKKGIYTPDGYMKEFIKELLACALVCVSVWSLIYFAVY